MSDRIKTRNAYYRVFMISLLVLLGAPSAVSSQMQNGARVAMSRAAQSETVARQQPEARKVEELAVVELGKPVERELSGGQSHGYRISMASGQFLLLTVDQLSIDVTLKLTAPDAKMISEVDTVQETRGAEFLVAIAEAAGIYRIDVVSRDSTASPGRYRINVEVLREARVEDWYLVSAESVYSEALRLCFGSREDKIKSLELLNEAIELYQKAGDRSGEGLAHHVIGGIYFFLGDLRYALEKLKQSYQIFKAIGYHRWEAGALNTIGAVYLQSGDMRAALENFNEALTALREADQHQAEKKNEYMPIRREFDSRYLEVAILSNIGVIYHTMGEWQKSLEAFTDQLNHMRAVSSRGGEATALENIGLVYLYLGEWQKASEKFDEAMTIIRAAGARRLGDPSQEVQGLCAIGLAHQYLGQVQKALDKYYEALPIARYIGNRLWETRVLALIGGGYLLLGETQKALDKLNEALPISRDLGDREWEGLILSQIGEAYQGEGEYQKALETAQQSLPVIRSLWDRSLEATSMLTIAKAEQKLGNLARSRQTIEEAISIVESLRANIRGFDFRASYLASTQKFYEFYLELLMDQHRRNPSAGFAAEALAVSERARARSLLELLGESRAKVRSGVDSSLLERERLLQERLNAKAAAQTNMLNNEHTAAEAEAATREIASLTAEYEELEAKIRASSPHYASLTQPQPLKLEEMQRQVLDEETLLLEYALGEERSYLWLVSKNSIDVYQLPPRAEIEAAARRVYQQFAARPKLGASNNDLTRQARQLSQILLGPIVERLGGKRLVVVAPGTLSYLSFGALPVPRQKSRTNGRDELLIARHEIINLPSASVLSVIRREGAGREPASKAVAILADPVFDANDSRLAAANRRSPTSPSTAAEGEMTEMARSLRSMNLSDPRVGFTRLAFSRLEAESIYELINAGKGLKATDFEASRSLVLSSQMSQYRILHFATHGLLNSEHPELSGLVFSLFDREGRSQDGYLRLHEIYNLELNADLVVLSACQTGLGKEIKGEGLIGLARGFMYAGAPRVVASLWKVDDLATAELMKLFYRGMVKGGLPAAAALRAAQSEMSRQKRWSSPYYWAGFVLQGEWR